MIMKKAVIIALVIFSGFSLFAQKASTTPPKFVISLNGGIATPNGSFSRADYGDEKSGFAKSGSHFNVTGVYSLGKNFGIGALVGYSKFGHKGTLSLAQGYKEDSGTDSTTLYTKGNNSTLSILVGPTYSIPVSDKFSIDLRVLGGYVNTHLAGFQVLYEDYTDNAMSQKKSSGGGFGLQAGAGLKYSVTDRISIRANVDYFTSKPKIDIDYENFVVNSGRKIDTYNEPVQGIAATIGVGFNLF
jgi:opacity protein-like surface antigen